MTHSSPFEELTEALDSSILSLAIARNLTGGAVQLFGLSSSSFLLWKSNHRTYAPLAHLGIPGVFGDWKVPLGALKPDHPLIVHLSSQEVAEKTSAPASLRSAMEAIQAEMSFALKGYGRLLAVFSLGPKNDKKPYSPQEREGFLKLVRHAAKRLELTYFLEERTLFSTVASHDIAQAFKWIPAHMDKLLSSSAGPLTPEQKSLLEDLKGAYQELHSAHLKLFNVGAFYNQLTASHKDWEKFDATELLKETAENFKKALPNGVTLETDLASKALMVDGRKDSVASALRQILANAARFTAPKGGRIRITSALENGFVKIDVEDSGPGIAALKLETLFQPFHNNSRPSEPEREGLGLLYAREIVEFHGGRLAVESQEGRGVVFTITLPVIPAK